MGSRLGVPAIHRTDEGRALSQVEASKGEVPMRSRIWLGIGLLGLTASIGAPARGEDHDPFDKAATTVNGAASTPAGARQVAGKIAGELNTACACSTFSSESVSAQRARTGWGWGEVLVADRLALAISQQSKISFDTALGQVTAARGQPAGWGAIAKANNLNVGQLVSGITKSADAVAGAGHNVDKSQGRGNAANAGAARSDSNPGVGAGHGAAGAGEGPGGGHGAGGGGQGGGGGGGGGGGAGGGGGGGGGKK